VYSVLVTEESKDNAYKLNLFLQVRDQLEGNLLWQKACNAAFGMLSEWRNGTEQSYRIETLIN